MITDRLLRVALLGSAWVLYLLLFLSIFSFSAMLDRFLYFRRHRDDMNALRRRLVEPLFERDYEQTELVLQKSPSLEARVLLAALPWRIGGAGAVADAVDSELARLRKELERGMTLLGTLGNNAPFVGLFGTVLGVIEAFHHLADGQNKAAMGNVMGSIAEALVATGVGLFVALPAVIAYNVAQKKIGEIEGNAESLAKLLTASLKLPERTDAAERTSAPDADGAAIPHHAGANGAALEADV